MKYRKKPIVIEAIQFNGKNQEEIKNWSNDPLHVRIHENGQISILTLEGVMYVSCFNYVIKGVNGEFYPCKPDIFEKTYEKVKETN